MALADSFHDGGWGMYPTLVFGLLLLGVAVRYAIRPESRVMPLLVALGVVTFSSGLLGFVSGLIATCYGIGSGRFAGTPDLRIGFQGFGESLNNMAFALMFVVIAALSASYGAFKASKAEQPVAA